MLTRSNRSIASSILSFIACIAIPVALLYASYQWGFSNAIEKNASAWSSYSYGPLYCIAHGDQVRCAAHQVVHIEPQSLQQDTADLHASTPQQQHECIALAVFTEARGESVLGQAAVAQTVVNRAKRLSVDACEVVTQVSQYQGLERLTADPWLIDEAAWERAVQISTSVAMDGYDTGACATATSFHAGDPPAWASAMDEVCRVGAHRFYRES